MTTTDAVQGGAVDARAVVREALAFVAESAELSGYGYARPEDPRDFFPDGECCTPEEIENHRKACALWEAAGGEPEGWTPPPGSEWVALPEGGAMHILRAPWGIGGYTYRDPELCALRDRLAAVLAQMEQ